MKHFCTNTTSSMIMIRLFRKKFLMKCRIAEDCVSELGSLIRYLQISYIVQNVEALMDLGDGIGTILQEGKPSCTERMLWQIIFPKVLVYPKNILIFHVVDGNEIRYQMRRTISIDSYTSPVNAGADEIRDTAVMVLFQGKEFSLSKPERENSSINMVCSHPQLGSPLCGSCRRLRGCRCV